MITLAVFHPWAGQGQTTLVRHLATILSSELGQRVLAVDLDPQAHLTAQLGRSQPDPIGANSLSQALAEEMAGAEAQTPVSALGENLWLMPCDLSLATCEAPLAAAFGPAQAAGAAACHPTMALRRLIERTASALEADWVLLDLGPNFTALNRASLQAAQHLLIPTGLQAPSLAGLRLLGDSLRAWGGAGLAQPLGYVLLDAGGLDNPLSPEEAAQRVCHRYHAAIDGEEETPRVGEDPRRLATLRHNPSLFGLALSAHKAMFHLRHADGARGALVEAVWACRGDYLRLAQDLQRRLQPDEFLHTLGPSGQVKAGAPMTQYTPLLHTHAWFREEITDDEVADALSAEHPPTRALLLHDPTRRPVGGLARLDWRAAQLHQAIQAERLREKLHGAGGRRRIAYLGATFIPLALDRLPQPGLAADRRLSAPPPEPTLAVARARRGCAGPGGRGARPASDPPRRRGRRGAAGVYLLRCLLYTSDAGDE